MASLFIKDPATADLVDRLAKRRGITKTEAVRLAVQADLERLGTEPPVPEWLADFWRRYPIPEPTGLKADKAFFDELSGDL
ncbi:hypothetical protein GCM10009087_10530 [Sphingomonas oligophenolica]|uniref:Type II toxin-antitoxin system VapB family antitoxin n=1 Tax=Sphingomonas oligophenolica TaxID=301154 RepID=A0ABU9Y9W8_9SPHN